MLIKVFGKWINSTSIACIDDWDLKDKRVASINFTSSEYIRFDGKTGDELAQEINRQIRETTRHATDK